MSSRAVAILRARRSGCAGVGTSRGAVTTFGPRARPAGEAGRRREIVTKLAQTRHRFAVIVLGEGGGTTPRPWVGDRSASASRVVDQGARA